MTFQKKHGNILRLEAGILFRFQKKYQKKSEVF